MNVTYSNKYLYWIFFISGQMELLWLLNCGIVYSGAVLRRSKRSIDVAFIPSSPCLQIGQIMEILKWYFDNHGKHCRRSVQSNIRPLYYCIHIRCYGNATFWQRLYWICLWKVGLWTSQVEFYGFHAQFYDSVPCTLWRMDWIYVGLHVGRRQGLCPILPGYRSNWKPCHSKPLPCFVAQ